MYLNRKNELFEKLFQTAHFVGATEETRTPTSLRLDPKSSAAANYATVAKI